MVEWCFVDVFEKLPNLVCFFCICMIDIHNELI